MVVTFEEQATPTLNVLKAVTPEAHAAPTANFQRQLKLRKPPGNKTKNQYIDIELATPMKDILEEKECKLSRRKELLIP